MVWQRRERRNEKRSLIQVGMRKSQVGTSVIGHRKVGEVGGKQTLLADVKLLQKNGITLSLGEVPTVVFPLDR